MKLPSLNHIYRKATITLRRFPFTLFSAAVVTAIIILLTHASPDNDIVEQILGKITMCGFLGVPLFTAITLFVERRTQKVGHWWLSHLLGLALLIAYYFTLPGSLDGPHYIDIYRYGLFILGVHLLVSIAPYWGESDQMSFWQYNKLLFLRFLTALLFSAVLYAGLAVALLSIHVLLGLHIDYKVYLYLATFMGFMFNTWFFLAGIPTSLEVFEKGTSYPKGLKIFTQNVLLPLVVVYVIILYLYMIKIIAQWTWPEGWVTILVLSFSIVGILAILLLYPIRYKAENKWINRFYTGYFAALVPLVILLLLAIYRRVADYGITINRYFVIILALWLAGMMIYFLVSKSQNIKVIPGSLCIIAFVISFGPWGAFSVSRRSQVHRLSTLLKENDILQNGTIHKTSSQVSRADYQQIRSILQYINNIENLDAIQPWFHKSLTKETVTINGRDSVRTIRHYSRPNHALTLMGVKNPAYSDSTIPAKGTSNSHKTSRRYFVYPEQKNVFPVEQSRWFIHNLQWSNKSELRKIYSLSGRKLIFESHAGNGEIHIYYEDAKQKALTVHMDDIIRQLQSRVSPNQHQLPTDDLVFALSNDSFHARLYIERLNWSVINDSIQQKYGTFSFAFQ